MSIKSSCWKLKRNSWKVLTVPYRSCSLTWVQPLKKRTNLPTKCWCCKLSRARWRIWNWPWSSWLLKSTNCLARKPTWSNFASFWRLPKPMPRTNLRNYVSKSNVKTLKSLNCRGRLKKRNRIWNKAKETNKTSKTGLRTWSLRLLIWATRPQKQHRLFWRFRRSCRNVKSIWSGQLKNSTPKRRNLPRPRLHSLKWCLICKTTPTAIDVS